MNVKQAAKKWNLKEDEVRKICKYYNLQKNWRGYEIFEDLKPVYIPDKRYLKGKKGDYFFVCEAINKRLEIDYGLIHSDEDSIKTVVRELRNRRLLINKVNHPNNLDYHNYILSPEYSDWDEKSKREKYHLITSIFSSIIEAGTKGAMAAILENQNHL